MCGKNPKRVKAVSAPEAAEEGKGAKRRKASAEAWQSGVSVIELWAGVGSLSQAARDASEDVVVCCLLEKEKAQRKILERLFPGAIIESEYENMAWKEWRAFLSPRTRRLLLGGPPCQPFSEAGLRGGAEDPRSGALEEYLGDPRGLGEVRGLSMTSADGMCRSRRRDCGFGTL